MRLFTNWLPLLPIIALLAFTGSAIAQTSETEPVVAEVPVVLTWDDNSANEDGFLVQRRDTVDGEWAEIGLTGVDVATFSDSLVDPGSTYWYRVYAYNGDGLSAGSTNILAVSIAGPRELPADAGGLGAEARQRLVIERDADGAIILRWE